jgi:hypothetical protein
MSRTSSAFALSKRAATLPSDGDGDSGRDGPSPNALWRDQRAAAAVGPRAGCGPWRGVRPCSPVMSRAHCKSRHGPRPIVKPRTTVRGACQARVVNAGKLPHEGQDFDNFVLLMPNDRARAFAETLTAWESVAAALTDKGEAPLTDVDEPFESLVKRHSMPPSPEALVGASIALPRRIRWTL